tara:strand:+ start:2492 stop:3226 length:735 start_codon:yes stop_codon:yes gene_type:complete
MENCSYRLTDIVAKSSKKYDEDKFFMFKQSSTNIFLNNYSYQKILDHKVDFSFFDNIFCDGALFAKLCSIKTKKKINRISFDQTSAALDWIEFALKDKMLVIVIGGTEEDSIKFKNFLSSKYIKNSNNIFSLSGFNLNLDDLETFKEQNCLYIVGMGSPIQEKVINKIAKNNLTSKKKNVFFTCGGFITQTANSTLKNNVFYPKFINTFNLRWFWRMIKQPFTIKRLLFTYPRSIFNFLTNEEY